MSIIKNVRASYMQVFEPKDAFGDGKLAYSCTFLIPKTDKATIKLVEDLIAAAVDTGSKTGKFKANAVKLPGFKSPLRDGDVEREANPDSRGPEYKGCMFFNARNTNPIGCVDSQVRPIPQQNQKDYYSGWWVNVDVSFYPFNRSGSQGVAAGLNNIMFVHSDERLDGRQNAVDAFSGLAADSAPAEGESTFE